MNKKIILLVALILIAASILYFESKRPKLGGLGKDVDILIEKTSGVDLERIELKAKTYERAKELVDPEGYINVDNITIAGIVGKNVILVDFWTYSCINCQRTFPYLTKWYSKYEDKGLVVIGVHTPEFEFEKNYDNVARATKKWGINYPVVQDNDYQTWRAYNNHYWPNKYLIDIDGFIVFEHAGEGAYEETEMKIQELLNERSKALGLKEVVKEGVSVVEAETPEFFKIRSPEIYFGYEFSRNQMGNKEGLHPDKIIEYRLPSETELNKFYLEGSWKSNNDNMELTSDKGKILFKYNSKNVNLVAGSPKPEQITVLLDGKEIGKVEVSNFDLYRVVEGKDYSKHDLLLEIPKGVMVYTFTFG